MKKTTIIMLCLAACFAAADTKITWLADVTADRAETVTGPQSNVIAAAAAHIPRTDNPHGVTAPQIGALTTEVDPVAGPRLDLIEPETNKWNAAYAWGDHALAGYLLPADLAPYATTTALAAHTNRNDNPHNVTAPQIGALTAEQDLVALAADRFLPIDAGKNAISTDAGSGSIVTYSTLIGDRAGNSITGANVVAIGRDAARKAILATGEEEADVIAIGENAAEEAGQLYAVSNVIAIGDSAFKSASGVKAIAIGDDAGFAADIQRGIAVGWGAGYGSTLVNSTVIGTDAGSRSSLTNSVAIGPSAGEKATGTGMLFIDSSGTGVADHPEYAMIYGSNVNLTLGKGGDVWPYSINVLRGNWLLNNDRILTNEQDLAALRAYHYGSPDIVESPAEWFVFDDFGKIFNFNPGNERKHIVVPWQIRGVDVTTIGVAAFASFPVETIRLPKTITAIEQAAFEFCQTLTNVYFTGDAPTEGLYVYADSPSVTNYVTDPQATGWGDTWNGAPVVRPPLYGSNVTAQAFTLGGDTITEWPSGAELPDGIVTNGADGPLALAGIGLTNGVLRAASGRLGRITLDDNGIHDVVWGTVFSTQSSMQLSIEGSAHIGGFYDYSSRFHGCQGGSQKILELYDWKYGPRTAYFDHDGSLMSSGTVYAAEVRSTGEYIIGPTISDKQAHIFTDGTNCFFVNVNSVTNALTTN